MLLDFYLVICKVDFSFLHHANPCTQTMDLAILIVIRFDPDFFVVFAKITESNSKIYLDSIYLNQAVQIKRNK